MYPTIDLGFLKIPSYAAMILIGGIAFTILTIYLFEKKEEMSQEITNRILIISMFGFAILVLSAFVMNSFFHSIEKKRLFLGGITWLGGVLWAFPSMVVLIHRFCPKVKGKALDIFDLLVPGITLAHGFGRIGCFMGGCCYGKVTTSLFGVSFPEGSSAALRYPSVTGGSLPVLPTQLFEALFEFLLVVVMIILYKKIKSHFFEMYAFSYGIFRFVLEFSRGDNRGTTGLVLSPSQIMSIILVAMGALSVLYRKRIVFKNLHKKMDKYLLETKEDENKSFGQDIIQTIHNLKLLLDEGAITKEEFESKKKELLSRI